MTGWTFATRWNALSVPRTQMFGFGGDQSCQRFHSVVVEAHLSKKAEEQAFVLQRIPVVPDVQFSWALLFHCAAARANFLLRVVKPAATISAIMRVCGSVYVPQRAPRIHRRVVGDSFNAVASGRHGVEGRFQSGHFCILGELVRFSRCTLTLRLHLCKNWKARLKMRWEHWREQRRHKPESVGSNHQRDRLSSKDLPSAM